ncbi:MAG: Hpt domain-containing protein [Bacteroidetes bacterium]|nr:Hpt domain-containing protein [Bacteroidota bacterium]
MPDRKKFDLGPLKELCSGDEVFYAEMIKTFFRTTLAGISSMQKAAEEKKWKEVSELAHKMRGPCTHLSTHALSELLVQIEKDISGGQSTDHIPGLVSRATQEAEDVIGLIKTETGL